MLRQQTVRMGRFPRTFFLHTGVYLAGSDKRHGALKGYYRFLKLFSWSYIYTCAQTVLLCRGWIKIELMRCGLDMAGGWEEKEIVLVFYTVPCGVNPTNTTMRVHWVKSKGKTFHLCARIVSYFTSNVRHSKSMGALWLSAHNCLIRLLLRTDWDQETFALSPNKKSGIDPSAMEGATCQWDTWSEHLDLALAAGGPHALFFL